MTGPDEYIFVGKLGRTAGINGSLTIVPLTSFPERFSKMRDFFLTKEKCAPVYLEVEKVTYTDKRILVKFKGIDSEEKAKELTGYRITVARKDRVKPPKDCYFVEDLLECEVVVKKTGRRGKMKDVMDMSSNDIYVIDFGGQEVLVPAIKQFVKDVDIERKQITVELADGMLSDED